jgi:hypothetical protein
MDESFQLNVDYYDNWTAITNALEKFPKPLLCMDGEGEVYRDGWIYRGHKNHEHNLRPSIERICPRTEWPLTEYRILQEFQSKAPMHMSPAHLPPTANNRLSWLAIMQHYGAPTRLLDFTYSPYVALYFALRNRQENDGSHAEVWAINVASLHDQADKTHRAAERAIREHNKTPPGNTRVSMLLADFRSSLQTAQESDRQWTSAIENALNPCGVRREHYNKHGFVGIALPPVQNVRLSSQQGVFLFNGAESLTFEASLHQMMQAAGTQWYRRLRIPKEALRDIEARLFQSNIHDLSLFPDAEGLAGFVRQKARLHW